MRRTRWTDPVELGGLAQLRAAEGFVALAEQVDSDTWLVHVTPEQEIGIAPAVLIPVGKAAAKVFKTAANSPAVQARVQQRLAWVKERLARNSDSPLRIRRPFEVGGACRCKGGTP